MTDQTIDTSANPAVNLDGNAEGYDTPHAEIEAFYRNNFNTELEPEEEFRFHSWADEHKRTGDLDDYDLRGAWKEGAPQAENGHFPDTYKKPNHPTFSNQSIYSGTPNMQRGGIYEGGTWGTDTVGGDTFTPSQTMLDATHPIEWLRSYMREREPDTQLLLPGDTQ